MDGDALIRWLSKHQRLFEDFLPFNNGILQLDEDGRPVRQTRGRSAMSCHTSRLR
jgi:hypothetical protein